MPIPFNAFAAQWQAFEKAAYPKGIMKLIKFPEANTVYAKDQPEYEPLPAHHTGNDYGEIVCCWQLSFWECLKLFWHNGRIWHRILTFNSPLQPQALSVDKPEMKA